jgi:hypothetical protein
MTQLSPQFWGEGTAGKFDLLIRSIRAVVAPAESAAAGATVAVC